MWQREGGDNIRGREREIQQTHTEEEKNDEERDEERKEEKTSGQ